MAEGLKLVIDALDLGWTIRTLVFAKSALGNAAVEKVAARTVALGGDVLEVSEKILAAITRRDCRNPRERSRRARAKATGLRPKVPEGMMWVSAAGNSRA